MKTSNKIVQNLSRFVNRIWFGLGLPDVMWPNPDTTPPPADDRTLAFAAIDAVTAVGRLL